MSGTVQRSPILAGTASLTINGNTYSIVSDAEYLTSGTKLETLKGQTAVEGASAMPEEGYVSATLRMRADLGLSALRGATGVTAIMNMANGIVVTVTNGWVTEVGPVKTQEGSFDIKIESADVTEDLV